MTAKMILSHWGPHLPLWEPDSRQRQLPSHPNRVEHCLVSMQSCPFRHSEVGVPSRRDRQQNHTCSMATGPMKKQILMLTDGESDSCPCSSNRKPFNQPMPVLLPRTNVQRGHKSQALAGPYLHLIDPPPLLGRLHSSILRVRQKSRQPS